MEENKNQKNIQNNKQNNIENNEQNNIQQNQSNDNNSHQQQENNNNNNNNNQNQIQEQNNNNQNQQQNNQGNAQQNEQHNNQENNQLNNPHNNQINTPFNIDLHRQEEEKIIETIKLKIKNIREKYNFSIQYSDIIQKIIKSFHEQTYTKLSHSINESLNFITFFKDSAELYTKFSKQIQETNNLIMSSEKQEKLNDNLLLDVMQKTQNTLLQNITKISNAMRQNIIKKGPLGNLQEKINKIENIKKENNEKLKNILESQKQLQKNMSKYDTLFDSYLPRQNSINKCGSFLLSLQKIKSNLFSYCFI